MRVETFRLGLKSAVLDSQRNLLKQLQGTLGKKVKDEPSDSEEEPELQKPGMVVDMLRLAYVLTNKILDVEVFNQCLSDDC